MPISHKLHGEGMLLSLCTAFKLEDLHMRGSLGFGPFTTWPVCIYDAGHHLGLSGKAVVSCGMLTLEAKTRCLVVGCFATC